MMKYTKPEITICRFSAEDIITDSVVTSAAVQEAFKSAGSEVNVGIPVDVSAYLGNE